MSDGLLHSRDRGFCGCGISLNGDRFAAHGADFSSESFGFPGRLLIRDRNVGTIFGQFQRSGRTDTACRTSDDARLPARGRVETSFTAVYL